MHSFSVLTLAGLALISTACSTGDLSSATTHNPDEPQWQDLFNGRDLDDWTIKITGFPAGENAYDTFGVEDGNIVARYDQYDEFNGEFGHLIYHKEAFSHYRLQIEYRFVGEQVAGGPGWAYRNNGIMYHSQEARDMALDQDFPTSLEFQLLGGNGTDPRSTANLCTPGTHVVMEGELITDHCITSDSETYHGGQWVTVELEVHGSERAIHRVEGDTVMEYGGLQLDDGTPLESGQIAFQAESHPTDIRSVRLLNLKGCMDEAAENYRSYLVAHDADSCRY